MSQTRILTVLLLLSLSGCSAESYWKLASDSRLPEGLKRDPQLVAVAQPQVEVWLYTDNRAKIEVFDAKHQEVFERQGTFRSPKTDDPVVFFITVNGVETAYRHVGPANTVAAVQKGG